MKNSVLALVVALAAPGCMGNMLANDFRTAHPGCSGPVEAVERGGACSTSGVVG